jgi:hypothetical protein
MFSPQDELAAVDAAMRENVQLMMQKRNGNSSPYWCGTVVRSAARALSEAELRGSARPPH